MSKKEQTTTPKTQRPNEQQSSTTRTTAAVPDAARVVHTDEATISTRFKDIYQVFAPVALRDFRTDGQQFECIDEQGLRLRIDILTARIWRIRYAYQGQFERDFSYAIDPQFEQAEVSVVWKETATHYQVQTEEVVCTIAKSNLALQLSDKSGQVMLEDAAGFQLRRTIMEGVTSVSMYKKAQAGEQFFGLGDKSCAQNMYGERLENWCSDSFAYGKDTDPLYRAIPFYYGLHRGRAYGVFFDNTYRTTFDFAKTDAGIVHFSATGGEMNYYYIHGPALNDVAQQYTELTGRPELPARWVLGFHQCRWSYFPESRVHEVADEFRKLEIPCDAIYLDIDYMDGYRCFTWNKKHFPQPTSMIADLRDKGFKTVVMIDPGIKEDPNYHVYQQMMERSYQCKRTNGDAMIGPVWPQECVFPDFTRPEVRAWWSDLYESLYVENDVAGFWNDMNEPAIFKITNKTFPDEVLHDYDGDLTNHRKAHNIYGQQMARSTYEGLKKWKPNHRPLVITRATYSGGQRHACAWTGDNVATWEHLRIANVQCQRMALSGFSHIGTDVGGFVDKPEPELMLRWLQLGVFHPFFRVHSMGNNADGAAETDQAAVAADMKKDRKDREPWTFGERFTALNRMAIQLRYQLLPYIYTAFRQYVQTGMPMLRNLTCYDQYDVYVYGRELEFIFGQHILVRTIVEPMEVRKSSPSGAHQSPTEIGGAYCKLYLPKGRWYDYWTGMAYEGGQEIETQKRWEGLPIYIKAGAVIPHYPVMQYTDERVVDELTLHVYFSETEETSELYEDAGEGYDYQSGKYSLKTFTTAGTAQRFTIRQQREGQWEDTYKRIELILWGLPFAPEQILVDGHPVAVSAHDDASLRLSLPNAWDMITFIASAQESSVTSPTGELSSTFSYSCVSFDELSLQQLYDIMALRQRVFVVEQDCPYLDADGKDQLSHHLLCYDDNGVLVGYTRLVPLGISYEKYASIGRVVNAPEVRGKGVGRTIMQQSIEHIKRLYPDVAVKISAQSYLLQFYAELGFKAVGESYLEDNIPHQAMVLEM